MNFLQWEMMRHFRGIGVRQYDFVGVRIDPEVGSKQEGIRRFKERFGGQLVQGYMWKFPFRPVKRLLYSLVMHLRSGGDVVDMERHKLVRLKPNPALSGSSTVFVGKRMGIR
jgi:lipid II:glycine glycyltransferase (peptidoglycan interpeptide bridge formation enzyme)